MSLKILILSDAWYPQVNGVVRTYENLKVALEDMGHTVRIFGPRDCQWRIPMPGYAEIELAILSTQAIQRVIKKEKPDIIHIATEGPIGRAGRKWCLRNNVPFSTCYHTHFPDYLAKRVRFMGSYLTNVIRTRAWDRLRAFHAPASCIYTATQSLEDDLRRHGFKGPFRRLSRGIKADIFNPQLRPEAPNIPNLKRPVALYVGRIAPEKNIDAFLDMEWTGSKVVVGTGPDLEPLKSRYPTAYFMGVQSGHTLADYYRLADVFVFPSRTDTFGMVLIEALACGVPIAAYPVPGPQDIVTSPKLGCLNDNLSVAAQNALQHGDRNVCAKHAATTYDWQQVARQFLESETTFPCHLSRTA